MGVLCAICTSIKTLVGQVGFGESPGTAAWWNCNSETIDKSVNRTELLIKWVTISVVNCFIVIVGRICIKVNIRRVDGFVSRIISKCHKILGVIHIIARRDLLIKRVSISIVKRIIVIVSRICIRFNIRRVIGLVLQTIRIGHNGFKVIPLFILIIAAHR
jgi:hypothetical protein